MLKQEEVLLNNITSSYNTSEGNIGIAIYSSILDIESWDYYTDKEDVFLQEKYLTLLEKNAPKGIEPYYIVFSENHKTIGVAYYQLLRFKGENGFNNAAFDDNKNPCFFHVFARYLKGLVSKKVEFSTLISGNLAVTGEHGFYFKKGNPSQQIDYVNRGLEVLRRQLEKTAKKKISLYLAKDFLATAAKDTQILCDQNYAKFSIQPNMEMAIRPNWSSYEDYLMDMTSKYRVRARRAAKKGADIKKVVFGANDIETNLPRLYDLYKNVAGNVGFNVVDFPASYFLSLKESFGDDFQMIAYYLEEEIIAFYTTLRNGDELEAHYLGFDHDYNPSHQVYLNILYDIVKQAIDLGDIKKIVFARTALEIKSSVGAVPVDMHCFMKHRNSFSNRFLTPILDYLNPDEKWVQRHPFKESQS